MSKLKSLTRKEFIKKLKTFSLECPFQCGDHQFMCIKNCKIKIPNPHSQKDVPKFIVQLTIKHLNISRNEWINA
jgi:hypothetical protein